MVQGTRILTLVQIADLHFVDIDPANGDPIRHPTGVLIWSNTGMFDGMLGHHRRGIEHLHSFYQRLLNNGEQPRLLVTGDVTSFGDGAQFDRVNEFLISQIDLNPPNCNFVGLHVNDWRTFAIPGNHDHFPGSPRILGAPTPTLKLFFPDLPYVRTPIALGHGRELIIAGINSDSDVFPWGKKRLLARGSFCNQLQKLSNDLGPPASNQVRILLVHHSWHHWGFKLRIDNASRAAFAAFLDQEAIKVILTGHTHTVHTEVFEANTTTKYKVLECRSGTTTQLDAIPLNWKTLFGRRPQRSLDRNSLIVHRIYDTGNALDWHAMGFVRKRTGFEPIGRVAERRMAVWT